MPAPSTDKRAGALLDALNELFAHTWTLTPGSVFYAFTLRIDFPDRKPFIYHRTIKPNHIDLQPYRTALLFADEVCERYGRYILLKPEGDED